MAKFPYLTGRKGSSNLYYKREVPLELRGAGRPAQIWRSLRTADRKARGTRLRCQARRGRSAVCAVAQRRQASRSAHPVAAARRCRRVRLDAADASAAAPTRRCPLPQRLRGRLSVARRPLEDRSTTTKRRSGAATSSSCPDDDWVEFKGKQHSYFAWSEGSASLMRLLAMASGLLEPWGPEWRSHCSPGNCRGENGD